MGYLDEAAIRMLTGMARTVTGRQGNRCDRSDHLLADPELLNDIEGGSARTGISRPLSGISAIPGLKHVAQKWLRFCDNDMRKKKELKRVA